MDSAEEFSQVPLIDRSRQSLWLSQIVSLRQNRAGYLTSLGDQEGVEGCHRRQSAIDCTGFIPLVYLEIYEIIQVVGANCFNRAFRDNTYKQT
jgi:hypothetical protein